jgi:electron transport complex protein RnfB
MTTENEIYRSLQKTLDKLPIGFPATESGVEIRILKHLFTPEEAQLATQLSMIPEPLNRIYQRVKKAGMSIEQLGQVLDRMVAKGSILFTKKGAEKLYSLMPLAVGMYELQVDRLSKDFARDMRQYIRGEYGEEMYRTKTPQLRTIPIERSIPTPDKFQVSTYDDVRKIIEDSDGLVAVVNCICRQAREVVGESCTHTDLRETCILLSGIAQYSLNRGMGRPITKEQAIDILGKAQEAGLVLQPENTQHPEYFCCCCGDCCGILTTMKTYPRPAELFASNYYVEVDPDLCSGCGICVERCQLEAREMVNGVAMVDLDRCIGCGNCVTFCESNANQLRRKERESLPPKDSNALYMKIMAKKVGRWSMLKMGAKVLLRRRV